MSKPYDKPILIQRLNEISEDWETLYNVHASINKAKSNSEYLNAGAIQNKVSLIFEIRYFTKVKDIFHNTQNYRILYENVPYNIIDYDDYMFKHQTVKLLGVSY